MLHTHGLNDIERSLKRRWGAATKAIAAADVERNEMQWRHSRTETEQCLLYLELYARDPVSKRAKLICKGNLLEFFTITSAAHVDTLATKRAIKITHNHISTIYHTLTNQQQNNNIYAITFTFLNIQFFSSLSFDFIISDAKFHLWISLILSWASKYIAKIGINCEWDKGIDGKFLHTFIYYLWFVYRDRSK